MTVFQKLQGVHPGIYCGIILFLASYLSVDIVLRDSQNCSSLSSDALPLGQRAIVGEDAKTVIDKWHDDEDKFCGSVLGHLPPPKRSLIAQETEDPWNHMKWVGKPARCKVKGQLIEALDETYNFRRGYALRYASDVEDKSHLLPWLLGNKVNLDSRVRRVYIDLGANTFESSIKWFMRMYPCDFTEVHAFESNVGLLHLPEVPYKECNNSVEENIAAVVVDEIPGIPGWMVNRMNVYNSFVSDQDDVERNAVNITRFMKETLKLRANDAVVVKMDIEGREWPILERWLDDPQMMDIIDELFVEIHYSHPTMASFGWLIFNHTREQATQLLANLRLKGLFVHPWP